MAKYIYFHIFLLTVLLLFLHSAFLIKHVALKFNMVPFSHCQPYKHVCFRNVQPSRQLRVEFRIEASENIKGIQTICEILNSSLGSVLYLDLDSEGIQNTPHGMRIGRHTDITGI